MEIICFFPPVSPLFCLGSDSAARDIETERERERGGGTVYARRESEVIHLLVPKVGERARERERERKRKLGRLPCQRNSLELQLLKERQMV